MYKPGFTPRLIERWREEILRPVARRYAEDFVAAADGKRANLVDYGLRYPVRMIYEILGFPTDDEASYEQFASSGLTMLLAIGGTDASDPEQATFKHYLTSASTSEAGHFCPSRWDHCRLSSAPGCVSGPRRWGQACCC